MGLGKVCFLVLTQASTPSLAPHCWPDGYAVPWAWEGWESVWALGVREGF